MQVFYSNNIINHQIFIENQEHIHLTKVLRKVVGDKVYVIDGKGNLFYAEIVLVSKKLTQLAIFEVAQRELKNACKLQIAIAPTKSMDRFEWFVEKAIEVGIKDIMPFYSQNSERRSLKLDRLQGIAIAAMKQSKSLFMPIIHESVSFNSLLQASKIEQKYIAYVEEKTLDIQNVFSHLDFNNDVLVVIGPEGGFTAEEVKKANSNGFKSISLGSKRLRTETAGVYSAIAYQLFKR